MVREHFKAQFLKGFKKNQQGQVTRVQDFVMPSFRLKNKQVEVISDVSTSSSDLFSQLSSVVEQKVADMYKPTNDLLSNLKGQIDILKKGKSVDGNCSFQTVESSLSALPKSIQQPPYGMPMNYFAGQTPPLQASQPSTAGPVRPVQQTGQTGSLVVTSPIVSIPCSAVPSRMNELTNSVSPLLLQESSSPHELIFDNVYENSLGCAPVSSIQTMDQDDPIAHRLNSASQTSTSGRCKANLAKLKEDLADHNEVKLSDLSSVR